MNGEAVREDQKAGRKLLKYISIKKLHVWAAEVKPQADRAAALRAP